MPNALQLWLSPTCLLDDLRQLHDAVVPQVGHVGGQACNEVETGSGPSASGQQAAQHWLAASQQAQQQHAGFRGNVSSTAAPTLGHPRVRMGGGWTKDAVAAPLSCTARRRRRTTAHVTPAAASTTPAPMAAPAAGRQVGVCKGEVRQTRGAQLTETD